ncbi:MAG: aminoacyl-tRNA deacylase [Desulfosarcinaceae bacterium]
MGRKSYPVTAAIRILRGAKTRFAVRQYPYTEHGGALQAAECLKLPPRKVIKTLVMQRKNGNPLLILMHGGMAVSTRALARQIGARKVQPCDPSLAEKLTGYQVGGISPFGTRTAMPVYAQASIFELDRICINGGRRGMLVELDPAELVRLLGVTAVDAIQA